MPAVHLHCPLCTGVIQIDSAYAGQQVACPHCQGLLTIPPESVLFGAPQDIPPQDIPPVAPPDLPPEFPPSGYPGAPGPELVQLSCPICGGGFQVPPEMGGQQVGCPHCNNLVTLPQFGPVPEEPVASLPPAPSEPQFPAFAPSTPPEHPRREERSESRRERNERRSKKPARTNADDLLPPGAARPKPSPMPEPAAIDHLLPPGAASPAGVTSPSIDHLLPPGAAGSAPVVPAAQSSAASSAPRPAVVDTLLPPGAQVPEAAAGAQQVALPKAPVRLQKPPENVPAGAIVVPMPEGGFVTVQESTTKVITAGNQAIEVRKLTPEEKARRRMRKNFIMGAFCLLIMFIVFLILMNR